MTSRPGTDDRPRPGGVRAALFGPLDAQTRDRFGLTGPPDVAGSPAPARRLRDMTGRDVWAVTQATFTQIGLDRVTSVAGGITFFGLLSLFPAITAFVSLYGLLADPLTIQTHLDMLRPLLPDGALEIIRAQVTAIATASDSALSLAGILALLLAFWSANGGMKALLSALNVAVFQRETRSFLRLNAVSMCFTLGGLAMIGLMLVVIAVVPMALRLLPPGTGADTIIAVMRWPIMLAVLIAGLAAVYRWGPAAPKSRWRWISPGAVIAALALVATSMAFSWYAVNFGNYNETYGSLGAVVVLMTWLWLNATIVLVGAEINTELQRHLTQA